MANYPTSVPSFTNKSNGQTIDASHINDLQDEVVAIGSGLLQGTAPLASSKSTVASLSVLGNSTLAGAITISGSTSVSLSAGNTTSVALASSIAVLLITPNSSGSTLHGISGGSAGRTAWVYNNGAANLVLPGDAVDANSSAQRHFITGSTLAAGYSLQLLYIGTRWSIARPT
jgi:hypothetical protein